MTLKKVHFQESMFESTLFWWWTRTRTRTRTTTTTTTTTTEECLKRTHTNKCFSSLTPGPWTFERPRLAAHLWISFLLTSPQYPESKNKIWQCENQGDPPPHYQDQVVVFPSVGTLGPWDWGDETVSVSSIIYTYIYIYVMYVWSKYVCK